MTAETIKMQERLRAALRNKRVASAVQGDLTTTLTNIGFGQADIIAKLILVTLYGDHHPIEECERVIQENFSQAMVHGTSVTHILDELMKDCAHNAYSQVSKLLSQDQKIIDWGCGDGRVTNHIYNHISHGVQGYDVRMYPAPGVVAPISKFDGVSIPIEDGYYDAGVAVNGIRHESRRDEVLKELARIIRPGGRLAVIEIVSIQEDSDELERMFVNDYIYRRIFQTVGLPVSCTYETQYGWVQCFDKVGFKLEDLIHVPNPMHLAYYHPMIQAFHTRMVFKRNNHNHQ